MKARVNRQSKQDKIAMLSTSAFAVLVATLIFYLEFFN